MTKSSKGRINRKAAAARASNDVEGQFTKFVERDFFKATLRGELKFGTLEEYRRAEQGAAHRLSDAGEGTFEYYTREPLRGQTIHLADGTVISGAYTFGCNKSLVLERREDCLVFCATRQSYRQEVHKRILEKNPKLTHYVTFNAARFVDAARLLSSGLWPSREGQIIFLPIDYQSSGRSYGLPIAQIAEASARGFVKAVFTKPVDFVHEEEARFALTGPGRPVGPVLVGRMGRVYARAFAKAVMSSGVISGWSAADAAQPLTE